MPRSIASPLVRVARRILVGSAMLLALVAPTVANAGAHWDPKGSVDFPPGHLGSSSDYSTYLYNTGPESFVVSPGVSSSPEFEFVSYYPSTTVPPGGFTQIVLSYRRLTVGSHTATMSLTLSLPGSPTLTRSVSGSTSAGSPLATPSVSSLDFGSMSVGTSAERTFWITNGGDAQLTIHSIAGSRPELTVLGSFPVIVPTSNTRNFTVRFDALQAGAFSDSLTILSTAVNDSALELPAVAHVARPAIAVLDPQGFVPVSIGFEDSVRQEVTFRNDGDEWPLEGTIVVEIDSFVEVPGDPPLPSVELPQLRSDGDGVLWEIQADGKVTQWEAGGFEIGADWLAFPDVSSADLLESGRALRLGPTVIQDRWELTREIRVALAGAGVRYLETVRNVSASPAVFRMQLTSAIRLGETWQASTSSGDAVLHESDDWIVVANGGGPAIAHVIAGPGGATRPAYVNYSPSLERVNVDFSLALDSGQSASILHFLQQSASAAEAIERAGALRALALDATIGLDPFERQRVRNSRVPQAIWPSLSVFSIPPLASIPLALDFDGRMTDGLARVFGTLRIATNDPARPTITLPVELELTGSDPDIVDVGRPPDGTTLAARFTPNPASDGALRLAYSLPTSGTAEFALFDVRGRQIASRVLADAAAGPGMLDWNGAVSRRSELPTGVYWSRLTHAGKSVITKGVVLR